MVTHMQMIPTLNNQTMTSIELREVVNAARVDAGEKPIRNDQFFVRIEDELEGELSVAKKMVNPTGGRPQKYYDLTLDQCTLVGMRESKAVRRNVLAQIKRLEKQNALSLPDFTDPIAAAEAWIEAKKAELNAVATKSEIGSRREATSMSTASTAVRRANALERDLDRAKEYCTIKRMTMIMHGQTFNWRLLKSAAQDLGIPSIDVFDANYGTVKAYHADVWMEAYGLEVAE